MSSMRCAFRIPILRPSAVYSDPDKALVMTAIGQLVADGHAEWTMLDDGDVELSFNSGGTFLLAERVVIRLA